MQRRFLSLKCVCFHPAPLKTERRQSGACRGGGGQKPPAWAEIIESMDCGHGVADDQRCGSSVESSAEEERGVWSEKFRSQTRVELRKRARVEHSEKTRVQRSVMPMWPLAHGSVKKDALP
jgi:hypothetical protein